MKAFHWKVDPVPDVLPKRKIITVFVIIMKNMNRFPLKSSCYSVYPKITVPITEMRDHFVLGTCLNQVSSHPYPGGVSKTKTGEEKLWASAMSQEAWLTQAVSGSSLERSKTTLWERKRRAVFLPSLVIISGTCRKMVLLSLASFACFSNVMAFSMPLIQRK